jgi:hypothetical protein
MIPIIKRISPAGEVLTPSGGENIPVFYLFSVWEGWMDGERRWRGSDGGRRIDPQIQKKKIQTGTILFQPIAYFL